jgi:tetratricopeptide (TPR) repeat protein
MDNTTTSLQDKIKEMVEMDKGNFTPEELKMQEEALKEIYVNGKTPAKACGIDNDYLTLAYRYGYSLYQKNKFREAWQVFEWLKIMNPCQIEYRTANLHCLLQLKNWTLAINELMMLAFLNGEDPYPFAKMAECLIELNDLASALIIIEMAIDRAGDKKEYAADKAKWKMQYEFLLTQLEVDPAIIEEVRQEMAAKKTAASK